MISYFDSLNHFAILKSTHFSTNGSQNNNNELVCKKCK